MVKRLQINAVDGKPLPIIQTKLTIEKADDGQDKVFVYANDTKVMYFIVSGSSTFGITPLYNTNGTLQIYEGE